MRTIILTLIDKSYMQKVADELLINVHIIDISLNHIIFQRIAQNDELK